MNIATRITHTDTIYKLDSAGLVRFWYAMINHDAGCWCSVSGIVGSPNPVQSGWTECTPRSRQTAAEQAAFEADAEMQKKLARGYYKSTREALQHDDSRVPMLAQKFGDVDLSREEKIYIQPKLDGMRCIATKDGLWSRQGKRIMSCPHIEEELRRVFAICPDVVLDGEIYNHDLKSDFNRIMSLARKQKPSASDLAEAKELLQYHVYDVIDDERSLEERLGSIWELTGLMVLDSVRPVQTLVTNHTGTDRDSWLDATFEMWLSEGYEGMMVRTNAPYEHKRSKALLKRKALETEEFKLIRVEEGNGNWAGAAKRAVVELEDGQTCEASIAGTYAENAQRLANKDQLAGTIVTVRYLNRTPENKLRGGVVIDFHGSKRED
jgi:DNA ligase-1